MKEWDKSFVEAMETRVAKKAPVCKKEKRMALIPDSQRPPVPPEPDFLGSVISLLDKTPAMEVGQQRAPLIAISATLRAFAKRSVSLQVAKQTKSTKVRKNKRGLKASFGKPKKCRGELASKKQREKANASKAAACKAKAEPQAGAKRKAVAEKALERKPAADTEAGKRFTN